MQKNRIFVAINGYGVPVDIFKDLNYHAYLIQVFNYLWDKYQSKSLTIIPCGGLTDLVSPYKRTEAGEMVKWLRERIKKFGLAKLWRVTPCATEFTALENMLVVRRLIGKARVVYFCEKTQINRIRRLAKKIFGSRAVVMGIEFDGSSPHYGHPNRNRTEKEDLKYGLFALHNPKWRKMLKEAAVEKIRILRRTPPKIRVLEIDQIARQIRKIYYQKFRALQNN
ncbi:MAG: hypothetical protein Q8M83_04185 [bacterium]|nr:hypothetical protein [bacterium]